MNEMNLYDQFSNAPQCQLKNNWPKGWSNANNQSEMREIHIKREDGNFNFGNLYSYSPPYQEQQGYLESELKPSLSKNLHLPCNIPNAQQHQLDQGNYFYAAGNHQVPGGEDAINFDSSSNGKYIHPLIIIITIIIIIIITIIIKLLSIPISVVSLQLFVKG